MSELRQVLVEILGALKAIEVRLSSVESKIDGLGNNQRDGFEAIASFHSDWEADRLLNSEQHQRLTERLGIVERHVERQRQV